MAYFTIMAELRGCYSDNDSAHTIKVDTRKELKAVLLSKSSDLRDAGAIGLNKKAISWLANAAWKTRRKASAYPHIAPFRYRHQSSVAMGLFVYAAKREDYLAQDDCC